MSDNELGTWPVQMDIPVAWGDMDSLGHVNNTVYGRWFESVRVIYFERVKLADDMLAKGIGPILAKQEINYRLPVHYPDKVRAEATVTRIGTTSFIMGFRITSIQSGKCVADGEAVLVMVDYERGDKIPLDDTVKGAIYRLEAPIS